MPASDRITRLLTYWTPSEIDPMIDHLRKVRPQILQVGQFGPNFYSMLGTPELAGWLGAPVRSLDEAWDWWRRFIAEVHGLGIRVVGIFSVTYHYGNEDTGDGWFAFWKNWDARRFGPRPCEDPLDLLKRTPDGKAVWSEIPGRPMRQYAGCLNNPAWRAVLKGMVKAGIDLGLDGFNTVYNYMGCHCAHCVEGFRAHLAARYTPDELARRCGIRELATHVFADINWLYSGPADPCRQEALLFNSLSLKRAQDDIFGTFGQALKPDLIRAAWYHSYSGDGPFVLVQNDERSGLPRDLWAKDETFFWYCLSAEKNRTDLAKGYVGDITLEAKYYAAAGRGKPFIANKYDYNRYRLYIAEAAANRAIAFGYHWDAASKRGDREIARYADIIARYFGFLERHADLYDPVESCAEAAFVFSWTDVERGDSGFLRPMKRLARRVIDRHIPFDVLIDQDFTPEALARYRTVILPDIRHLGADRVALLRAYVAAGGRLIVTEGTGSLDERGAPRPAPVFDGPGVERIDVPQDEVKLGEDLRSWIPPPPETDAFGNAFADRLMALTAPPLMTTTAPWTVQTTPYRQEARKRLIVHCVNYRRDETQTVETPIASGPFELALRLPEGARARRVLLYSPEHETPAPAPLPFSVAKKTEAQPCDVVRFTVPFVVVYAVVAVEYVPAS